MEPKQIEQYVWEIPMGFVDGMNVPGRIFASQSILEKAMEDRALEQVANVATLPGIITAAMAMPDIHWGYGFPIGGVAATDGETGAISPGGVGFDIGCGVRLLRSDLDWSDVRPRIRRVVDELGKRAPRGVGGKGALSVPSSDIDEVLAEGVNYPLRRGVGWESDAEFSEDHGKIPGADPEKISERAKQRGAPQLGSLGAGNHFLEIQVVDQIRDPKAADVMGIFEDQVVVMIHSGSRGIGHQTCTDHLKKIDGVMRDLGIEVPDRQLACVPLDHPTAQDYMGAMDAAGNFAKANRHVLAHTTRDSFASVLGKDAEDLGMELVYDVSHNLAKMESYDIDGVERKLCVHRKGATRAFGPHHPEIPEKYKAIGQPVIVPGSMGTHSFLLVGGDRARDLSFSSTCHGAGRAMSRTKAKKQMSGEALKQQLEEQGITLARSHWKLLSEEAPYAYKDSAQVVEACEGAGLSKIVARLRPVGVVKG
jgi:tRNA-splicing ligase RtcB